MKNLADEAIIFDNCDDAIIGEDNRGYLVYSYAKLIKVFMSQGMTDEEAEEWIDYNVAGVMPQHYTINYENTYQTHE
jgi:hypothetical protein